MSAGRVSRARIWRALRWRYSTRRDERCRPHQNRQESEHGGSDLTRSHLYEAHRLTASTVAGCRTPVQTGRRRCTVDTRVECRLDGRLVHSCPVHAITAGGSAGGTAWAGHGAMRSAEGERNGEQGHEADKVGPGPRHLCPMLPKPATLRHKVALGRFSCLQRRAPRLASRGTAASSTQGALGLLKKRYLMDAAATRISVP